MSNRKIWIPSYYVFHIGMDLEGVNHIEYSCLSCNAILSQGNYLIALIGFGKQSNLLLGAGRSRNNQKECFCCGVINTEIPKLAESSAHGSKIVDIVTDEISTGNYPLNLLPPNNVYMEVINEFRKFTEFDFSELDPRLN